MVALILAGTAPAAPAPDPFDFAVANVVILQDKRVQNELKINPAQRNKMNVFAANQRATAKKVYDAARAAKQKDLNVGQQKEIAAGFETLRRGVLNILSTYQLKRLRELTVRSAGTAALLDPVVAKRLGLSAAQGKRLAAAFTNGQKSLRAAQKKAFEAIVAKYKAKKPKDAAEMKSVQAAFNAEMSAAGKRATPSFRAVESSTAKGMLGVLTAKQKVSFTALQGKPIAGK